MRHICVVTVARSDFGYLLPVMRLIEADPELRLSIVVTGSHLAPQFGLTVREVEAAGLPIAERVDMLVAGDAPAAIAKSIGLGVSGLAQTFARLDPDMLLLLGDRFETFAAAAAILPFCKPIAHVAGGETTEGAIDEAIRHAITKMSHLHFVATERYRQRVIQMGEEPWRVTVSGAPTLDNLRELRLLSREELQDIVRMPLAEPPLLVTFHPVTLEHERTGEQIDALFAALDAAARPVVFTYPNADTNAHAVIAAIDAYVATRANTRLVANLGTIAYFSLMRHAAAMVGNSSSGLIEAASFELPVVNIGNRQRGRDHGANVVDCACESGEIVRAIEKAVAMRGSLAGMKNPYGDGNAAGRIVEALRTIDLGARLVMKRFHDLPAVSLDEVSR